MLFECKVLSVAKLYEYPYQECLDLVQFNNFALTTGFYWSYMLLIKSPVLMRS